MCKYPNQRCFYRISTKDLDLISLCSLPLRSLMFLYSCLWMTTACARLYPLTLVWPDAWRFSTNSRSAYVLSCVCPSPVILSFSGRCAHAFVLQVFSIFHLIPQGSEQPRLVRRQCVSFLPVLCHCCCEMNTSFICFVACCSTFHFLLCCLQSKTGVWSRVFSVVCLTLLCSIFLFSVCLVYLDRHSSSD